MRALAALLALITVMPAHAANEPLPTASALQEQVRRAYRSARSYHDRGTAIDASSSVSFDTSFSREHGLKMTWDESVNGRRWASFVLWGRGDCFRQYMAVPGGSTTYLDCTRPEWLDGLGSLKLHEFLVPRLLIERFGRGNDAPVEATVQERSLADGTRAWVIEQRPRNQGFIRTWVDPATLRVLRYEQAAGLDTGPRLTIEYRDVELNAPVPEGAVTFRPPFLVAHDPRRRPLPFLAAIAVLAFGAGMLLGGIRLAGDGGRGRAVAARRRVLRAARWLGIGAVGVLAASAAALLLGGFGLLSLGAEVSERFFEVVLLLTAAAPLLALVPVIVALGVTLALWARAMLGGN